MMKIQHTIYTFLSLLTFVVMSSCEDHTFDMNDSIHGYGNAIAFDVSSGFETPGSRSGGLSTDDEGLPYLTLTSGSDTLYLHRYVATETERATGNCPVSSRSAQVNSASDFKTVNGENGFMVKALYSDGSSYFDFSVAKPDASNENGDVWLTEQSRYWPDGQTLHFNAYAPANAKEKGLTNVTAGKETITFDYTVPVSTAEVRTDAEVQPDLMFATTDFLHDPKRTDCDLAPLNFRHALSAIKFAVRDVANGEIVDISIKGVAGSGSCVFDAESTDTPFTWSNLGEQQDYTQTFNYKTEDRYTDSSYDYKPAEVIINNTMPEKTFMLIPQEIPDNAVLEITVNYGGQNKTLSGKLKTGDIPLWEAGKEYIYTISTSSENWTYVFNVTGSVQEENDETPSAGKFSVDNDNIIINATVIDGAFYNVESYRVRTNNLNIKEPVRWTAVSTDGDNKSSNNANIQSYITSYSIPMTLSPNVWFTEIGKNNGINLSMDKDGKFGDEGSCDSKQYNVRFKTQYVATDWQGDWDMRNKDEIGSSSAPVDLSLNNCGSASQRSTANCYVVNRGGWYKFPLVYGNAITNGVTNEKAYKFAGGTVNIKKREDYSWSFPSLAYFTDYKGQNIQGPNISGAESAVLVWQDAYGIIDEVQLDKSKTPNEVVFHVSRADLQQSNSVIGVRDHDGEIIWSWHIWVNEMMVDDNQKLAGGIECETWSAEDADKGYGPFELAQRNLGWCDPKNVQYLERVGTLTFSQEGGKNPDKTLNVKQRGKLIEFFIGNNTYYQWGRKDPMVGFRYSEGNVNYVKYNFGELTYDFMNYNNATISDGIKNPNCLLAGTDGIDQTDWLASGHYYNLWNNYHNEGDRYLQKNGDINVFEDGTDTPLPTLDYAYSAVKTIYDPSPAGFMVPPQKFFELLTKGQSEHKYVNSDWGKTELSGVFNGNREQKNSYFQYNAHPDRNGTKAASILLTGTGQRWHRTGHSLFPLGGNMNPNHIYLWANSVSFYSDNGAFSFVVGYESNFISTTRFLCRKSLARPVRSVREYTPKTLGH